MHMAALLPPVIACSMTDMTTQTTKPKHPNQRPMTIASRPHPQPATPDDFDDDYDSPDPSPDPIHSPHVVIAYALRPDDTRPRPVLRSSRPTLHEAIRLADSYISDPRYLRVEVRPSGDVDVVYSPNKPEQPDLTTPNSPPSYVNPGSVFRRNALSSDQPLSLTPKDVLDFAQNFSTLSIVELRVCAPPSADHLTVELRPTSLGRGWWVLFYHAKPKLDRIADLLNEFGSPAFHDPDERCIWIRPTQNDDAIPAPSTSTTRSKSTSPRPRPTNPRPDSTSIKPCLCGRCSGTTKSHFAIGHDARFYSMLAQFLCTGTLPDFDQLPPTTQQALRTWKLPQKKSYLLDKWQAKS